MLEAGLWSRNRKRKAYRQRRTRRRHFGELVQMDGSFEAWLIKKMRLAGIRDYEAGGDASLSGHKGGHFYRGLTSSLEGC
jgi:hypothetical protein